MSPSRRMFIRQSALALAGTTLFSSPIFAASKKNKITGLQLYSVREDMKKDPLGTLQQLSRMGYRYVEHAHYVGRKFYGYGAQEFKKILDDLGMQMPSGHTVLTSRHWDAAAKDFTSEWKYTVEDAATVGQQFVISPWLDESLRKDYSELMRFLELFNKSGELCQRHGMKYGYHNHDFEFSTKLNGHKLYDLIMQHTDPRLVIHQLDIGNMYGAGGRAMEIIKQYPGRFASLHVKDEIKVSKGAKGEGYESTVLGKGLIGVKEVIDLAGSIGGTEHFIIEQEAYQGQPPLDAMKLNLEIMKKWGY